MYLLVILLGSSLSTIQVAEAPVGKPDAFCEATAKYIKKELAPNMRYTCVPYMK